MLTTLAMGVLFLLKFQKESTETEYALKLQALVDESKFDDTTEWKERRKKYFQALAILDQAQEARVDLDAVLELATSEIDVPEEYRPVLVAGLQRNLKIAEELGILTSENMERLEAGGRLKINGGGYKDEMVVLDNIVPHRFSPELEMSYANLLLKPESVLRRYPDTIAEGAMVVMTACRSAEIMTETSFKRTVVAARQRGVRL